MIYAYSFMCGAICAYAGLNFFETLLIAGGFGWAMYALRERIEDDV